MMLFGREESSRIMTFLSRRITVPASRSLVAKTPSPFPFDALMSYGSAMLDMGMARFQGVFLEQKSPEQPYVYIVLTLPNRVELMLALLLLRRQVLLHPISLPFVVRETSQRVPQLVTLKMVATAQYIWSWDDEYLLTIRDRRLSCIAATVCCRGSAGYQDKRRHKRSAWHPSIRKVVGLQGLSDLSKC